MSNQKKKSGAIFFYVLAAIAFLLCLSGVGAIAGIPIGILCRFALKEGQSRD